MISRVFTIQCDQTLEYMEKYNKQKLIGTGAFGQAWLVQSKADGTKLVMKEIKIAKVSLF